MDAHTPAHLLPRRRATQRLAGRERRRHTRLLAEALGEGTLHLTRTPRFSLGAMTLVAEEVALHWPLPGLSATAALSATREPGLAHAIGAWMLDEACHAAARAPHACAVSVPLPAPMLNAALAATVTAALEDSALPAARLELRLPETGLLDPSTDLLLALSALRDQGVCLALDDFGMRHGSLSLLRHLPLNVLHLDPWLTQAPSQAAHPLDSEEGAMSRAMVDLAHALNLRVVARAIDHPARLAALRSIGVDEGMGATCAA